MHSKCTKYILSTLLSTSTISYVTTCMVIFKSDNDETDFYSGVEWLLLGVPLPYKAEAQGTIRSLRQS